ncbi:MAG: membrane protein insertase YidC [Candidatus Marinimicrobia bacterium]|nr:membrane protein insertase YidC [Candidatus Neomarinimicrobiota bacterium]MBL7023315.1 membrane protein insertase YidC [Candidatus Neomarinimicrobiota bacterium]
MNTVQRNLLAIVLSALVMVVYFMWFAPPVAPPQPVAEETVEIKKPPIIKEQVFEERVVKTPVSEEGEEKLITIYTDLFVAEISNVSGGSFTKFSLNNFSGSYNAYGDFVDTINVSLLNVQENECRPCLSMFDKDTKEYENFSGVFDVTYDDGSEIHLSGDEETTFIFSYRNDSGISIEKRLTIYGNSYSSDHLYLLNGFENTYRKTFELIWSGGLSPTERMENEDIQNGAATISQAEEIEKISLSKDEHLKREVYQGNTEWVAIKNKYFIAAILPSESGDYATMSADNVHFGDREATPIYTASVGYGVGVNEIASQIYLGPQQIDKLRATGTTIEDAMNWGFSFIRPISKLVLKLLTFLHNPFNAIVINYGVVLIVFALLIRIVTGPLMKKSARSTQKMQLIQPQVKAVQKKLKSNPQKMNQEVMALYKKHGVNPLGGCLPMLVQMPLLFALFVVFRNTIEFRGEPFIFWITDLSSPDAIFSLPFNIPIYGSHVAILPIIMGTTMFLQQKISSASMDKSQKPMMYMMTGFFFLLFNSFPSGLNLYYAVSNVLNILQQRSVKAQLSKE